MQIRERANRWALIRTKYDPAKKRGVAKCIGSVAKSLGRVPEDLVTLLTEDEREQLEKLLRKTSYERGRAERDHYAKMLPVVIDMVTKWYLDPTTGSHNLAGIARDTREAYSGLLNAMVKAGVGRTRTRRTKAELAKAAATARAGG